MATSSEIKARAKALAEKTDVNSITPKEVGGIMYDLASHVENVLRNGGTLGIRKVYESVAAMEADSTNPKDFWGDPIKKGNLVVIYDGTTTGVDNNKTYAFMKPAWELATGLDAGYAMRAETEEKLSELASKANELQTSKAEKTALQEEINRAKDSELTLTNTKASKAELQFETNRATSAERVLDNKILEETERAQEVETEQREDFEANKFGFNVTVYGEHGGVHNLLSAIKDMPKKYRMLGQKITFRTGNGDWATYHNESLSLANYENTKDWVQEVGIKEVTGDVNIENAPDYEDLTEAGNGTIKFADKEYSKSSFSGLGRIYLRKNIVNGVNILSQDMMLKDNTRYIIQYDYDLNGDTIEVPEGCVLDFQGGSLNNGTINLSDDSEIIGGVFHVSNNVHMCINVSGSNCRISDCSIIGTNGVVKYGIYVLNGRNTIIENCTVKDILNLEEDKAVGIALIGDCSNSVVRNCWVENVVCNSESTGIDIEYKTIDGVVYASDSISILNNTIKRIYRTNGIIDSDGIKVLQTGSGLGHHLIQGNYLYDCEKRAIKIQAIGVRCIENFIYGGCGQSVVDCQDGDAYIRGLKGYFSGSNSYVISVSGSQGNCYIKDVDLYNTVEPVGGSAGIYLVQMSRDIEIQKDFKVYVSDVKIHGVSYGVTADLFTTLKSISINNTEIKCNYQFFNIKVPIDKISLNEVCYTPIAAYRSYFTPKTVEMVGYWEAYGNFNYFGSSMLTNSVYNALFTYNGIAQRVIAIDGKLVYPSQTAYLVRADEKLTDLKIVGVTYIITNEHDLEGSRWSVPANSNVKLVGGTIKNGAINLNANCSIEGGTIGSQTTTDHLINIMGIGCTVKNVTINGEGSDIRRAIYSADKKVVVENCHFKNIDSKQGSTTIIYLSGDCSNSVVMNNTIENCSISNGNVISGIGVYSKTVDGVVQYSENILIKGNKISKLSSTLSGYSNISAITISQNNIEANHIINDNIVSECSIGFTLSGYGLILNNNRVNKCTEPIIVQYGNISINGLRCSALTGSNGIKFANCEGDNQISNFNVVNDTSVSRYTRAVYLVACGSEVSKFNLQIKDCKFIDVSYAIDLETDNVAIGEIKLINCQCKSRRDSFNIQSPCDKFVLLDVEAEVEQIYKVISSIANVGLFNIRTSSKFFNSVEEMAGYKGIYNGLCGVDGVVYYVSCYNGEIQ